MVDSLLIQIIMGTLLGFLSGLGTGGGSLLMLWLTLVIQIPVTDARAINLLFFLPAALMACSFRQQQGSLKIIKILPGILAGSIAAGVCSYFSATWDTAILQKLFGILLLITGTRELLYKPKTK